ncbi:MAG: T9SS type A sorting domain-containing protein, partial [Prevotella sp.]|nr:T9SS type A sorting domain-containing protein [Prevotella sp.]
WGEWFSSVMSVSQEDIYTKARGISLSKYADKDIIVAIGVVSKNGEALILDNIGFYGDVEKSEANAINAAVAGADENTIQITDNSVMAENGARIIVNDASGRLVADGEGSAHIAALQNGVYMATVKTAKGAQTVKFIKR